MSVPEQAEELQERLNEVARRLRESHDLSQHHSVDSEAVQEAIEEAQKQVKVASEQLANVVGGR